MMHSIKLPVFLVIVLTFLSTMAMDLGFDLNRAARMNNLNEIRRLGEQGADVNYQDAPESNTLGKLLKNGKPVSNLSALMWATLNCNEEMVIYLLNKGARVDLRTNEGLTVFDIAEVNCPSIAPLIQRKITIKH